MKKFLAAFLILIFMCSTALAATVDLSSMSDEEIGELMDNVHDEAFSRGLIFEQNFPAGNYIAGKNIKPGSYLFKSGEERTNALYYLYATEEGFINSDRAQLRSQGLIGKYGTESVQIYLEEGMALSIQIGFGKLLISTEKSAWMP